jgi:hypothetical protein
MRLRRVCKGLQSRPIPTLRTAPRSRSAWSSIATSYVLPPGTVSEHEVQVHGTGKTHCDRLGIRACQAGHRVLFATASEWVDRLATAHHGGRLQAELAQLGRYPLLIVDEVGYIRLVHWVQALWAAALACSKAPAG